MEIYSIHARWRPSYLFPSTGSVLPVGRPPETNATARRGTIDPIVGRLRDSLATLGGLRPVVAALPDEEVFDGLSRRMDPGHAVVLRGLLETAEPPVLSGQEDLRGALSTRFAALRRESLDRFEVLKAELPDRLGEPVLGGRLHEAGFYRQDVTWSTVGKGSRKDLRAVFLLCYRELLADCERVLVQCQSRADHLDDLAARQWLERQRANGERMGACLAEGLRPGESERLKSWRSSLGKACEDGFCQALAGKWEKVVAPSRSQLHFSAAKPWAPARGDGFLGFARAMIDHAQALAEAMVWLSSSRWEIHLRAAGPSIGAEP